jgi:murein DD-endopeptidase MepM/ murein hydrolase activator NlpD
MPFALVARSRPVMVVAAVVLLWLAVAVVPRVGGGAAPSGQGVTSTTDGPTSTAPTSTTVVDPPSTVVPSSAPPVSPPPTLGPLPLIELDPAFQQSDGPALNYQNQPAFDPNSNAVMATSLADAERRLTRAESDAASALEITGKLRFKLAKIENRLALLSDEEEKLVLEAASAYALLVDRIADAYVRGNDADFITLVEAEDPNEYAKRAVLVRAVLDADEAALDEYKSTRTVLTDELEGLHQEVGSTHRELKWAKVNEKVTRYLVAESTIEVAMWGAGAQVFARGFLFPVHGVASFGDSWGAPRMTGTAFAHWHEGTDVFAPAGIELVAVEDGVVTRTTDNTLGGISVYLAGESGIEYYYAHLSGYAPGVMGGIAVKRGDVLGYMGNTGNASGGAAHLHFEVHVGGRPVNPYPILATAYQFQAPLLALIPPPSPTAPPVLTAAPPGPTTTTTTSVPLPFDRGG